MGSIAEDIERTRRAVVRADERLADMRARARGGCCASCMFGRAYVDAAEKQDRREAWLAILLSKQEKLVYLLVGGSER